MAKKLKVFGFMINPHQIQIVSEDGAKSLKLEVESESQAKEKFMGDVLNQQLISTLGRTDFSTIWVDDPAGNQDVIEACKKMEQGQDGVMPADEGIEANAEVIDEVTVETDTYQGDEVSVHTKGTVFQVEVEGDFKNIPGQLLKIDDICRFFPERESVNETQWKVIASPVKVSNLGEEDNWSIQLKKIEDAASPKEKQEERSEPQFDTTGQTKIIEVECLETKSEQEMKNLGRRIRSLKAEALQTAAEYREDIKKLEKRFFEMCDGKSYTNMECTVVNDWEAGERKYIRPDTGEIARLEKIPYEEQQLNMNKDLEGDTSGETEQITEETEHAESETETDDNETTEQEPDGFPPPDEETESVVN